MRKGLFAATVGIAVLTLGSMTGIVLETGESTQPKATAASLPTQRVTAAQPALPSPAPVRVRITASSPGVAEAAAAASAAMFAPAPEPAPVVAEAPPEPAPVNAAYSRGSGRR